MKTEQKCQKLASVLETFVTKLRDPSIGVGLWETNERTVMSLVSNLHEILTTAAKLNAEQEEEPEEDFWPDILYLDNDPYAF